jgi:catechol 2,3-dioxygenase-like lactoylglutathione lyase family enzyme
MTGRVQLAINVDDLTESIAFYGKLFGTEPAKVRPGYANFAIADPPLKLVLLENRGHGGSLNHLGVEVPDTDAVDAAQRRLAGAGLASIDERDTTCCYARQNKFWVAGAPNGERWEIYTVLEDSPTFWGSDASEGAEAMAQCCSTSRNTQGPAAADAQSAPAVSSTAIRSNAAGTSR